MTREEKASIIESLSEKLKTYNHFYVTDIEGLNAEQTTALRSECYKESVKLVVVKNKLFLKALERASIDTNGLDTALKGSSSIMFCDQASVPAKMIKRLRKTADKPALKAAYVEESIYVGEHYLETLATIKSKNELIGDVIGLLQSPAKNVISGLQSGGQKLVGILKTLEEKKAS